MLLKEVVLIINVIVVLSDDAGTFNDFWSRL